MILHFCWFKKMYFSRQFHSLDKRKILETESFTVVKCDHNGKKKTREFGVRGTLDHVCAHMYKGRERHTARWLMLIRQRTRVWIASRAKLIFGPRLNGWNAEYMQEKGDSLCLHMCGRPQTKQRERECECFLLTCALDCSPTRITSLVASWIGMSEM